MYPSVLQLAQRVLCTPILYAATGMRLACFSSLHVPTHALEQVFFEPVPLLLIIQVSILVSDSAEILHVRHELVLQTNLSL